MLRNDFRLIFGAFLVAPVLAFAQSTTGTLTAAQLFCL